MENGKWKMESAECENSTPNSKFQIPNSFIPYETDGFAQVTLDWRAETPTLPAETPALPDGTPALPAEFALSKPFPNPFNSATEISFALPAASSVKLSIFDTAGREVVSLADKPFDAGVHRLVWQADNMPNGLYILRLEADKNIASDKLILIR
ncbi:MAG: T9SS type A sorting domain-containing protein [Calditrichaeota bacterium]|nr:T9SS type A sorting domain-containing protein [Calditrichota bacterium]